MRAGKSSQDQVAVVARRRLEQLGAELAELRACEHEDPPAGRDRLDPPAGRPDAPEGRADDAAGRPDAPDGRAEDAADRAAPNTVEEPPHRPSSRPGTAASGRGGRHAVPPPRSAPVAGWVQDRLPATLQGRVQLGAGHLAVLAVLVAAASILAAWQVVAGSGSGAPVRSLSATTAPRPLVPGLTGQVPASSPGANAPAGLPPAGVASPPPGLPSAPVSPTGSIVVDVAGRVRRPGIASLPSGSRVADAVEAAGGPRRGVSLRSLNLARILVDGEQVVVGLRPVPGVAASVVSSPSPVPGLSGGETGTPPLLVNINTASQAELEELPGVGPVTALAIMTYRTEHGGFSAVDELLEVSGIGDITLANIAPYTTI